MTTVVIDELEQKRLIKRASDKKSYDKHIEKRRETLRIYYQNNKEEINRKRVIRYYINKEKNKEKNKDVVKVKKQRKPRSINKNKKLITTTDIFIRVKFLKELRAVLKLRNKINNQKLIQK